MCILECLFECVSIGVKIGASVLGFLIFGIAPKFLVGGVGSAGSCGFVCALLYVMGKVSILSFCVIFLLFSEITHISLFMFI